jgi:hypothetical protein
MLLCKIIVISCKDPLYFQHDIFLLFFISNRIKSVFRSISIIKPFEMKLNLPNQLLQIVIYSAYNPKL